MNRKNGSSRAKRIVAAIVLAAMTFGCVFASPLSLAGQLGDAKVYDGSFKAVRSPSDVDDGWVVRTFDDGLTLVNDDISLKIGEGSLVRIIDLSDNPEVYLLDGWLTMTTKSGDAKVKTPSTTYTASQGTTLVVTSTDSTESAYIHKGSAVATDMISSSTTNVEEGSYVDATVQGFQMQAPSQEAAEKAVVVEAPAVEDKAEEQIVDEPAVEPVAETEEPVVEEHVAEEPQIEVKPLVKTFSYAGYKATITAYIGVAYVEYPAFVTAQEIYDAAKAALMAYPNDLRDVTIRVVEAGLAEITYPQSYGEREFDYAVALLEKELPYYIASLFAPAAPATPEAPVEPQVVVEETVRVPAAPVEPMVEITIKPVEPTEPIATIEETPAEVEVAAEAQEAPAPQSSDVEAPNADASEEASEEASGDTEVQVASQPVETAAKQSNVRFGATVAVEYGLPYEKAEYKGLVSNEYFRLGLFTKNVTIAVDPYITIGNFTVGLHLLVNTADMKSSFTFDKDHGIAGYVSSVAKYIGRIGYENEAGTVKVAVDRTHGFGFTSPVSGGYDREFDTTARLAASFEGKFGIVGVSAFADDLEMASKLSGKKQFAGLRVAVDAGPVEIGLSGIADIRSLDILAQQYATDIYPALDVNIPFAIGGSNVDIALGGATKLTAGNEVDFKTLPYLAKLNVKVSNDIYYLGVGAAYNNGEHLNGTVGNNLTTITTAYSGKSVDALLSAGLHWGPVAIDGSINVPFALNGTGLLAYNEVLTRSGRTENITADTLRFKAALSFGGFTLDGGIMFDGFCGRLADLSKALIQRKDSTDAVRGIQDPDLATYFVGMSYGIGGFAAHVKGSYMAVENETVNTRVLALTVGGSYTF